MTENDRQNLVDGRPALLPRSRKQISVIMGTYGLRLLGQGVAFFLFARALEPAGFGYVTAALAILGPLSPLVDMGAYSIVSRDIALGRKPAAVVGENLRVMLVSFPLGLLAGFLIAGALYGRQTLVVFVLVGVGYLLLSRTSLLLAAVQNTVQQRVPVVLVEGLASVSLLALGLYGVWAGYSLLTWATCYALVGIATALAALMVLRRSLGSLSGPLPSRLRLQEGLTFSLGNSFQYLYLELDKILLLRFAVPALTGVYGISSRVAGVSLMPIGAVYSLFYPQFMQLGHDRRSLQGLLKNTLLLATGYSALAAVGLYVLSLFLPALLGDGYGSVRSFLMPLIMVVVFQVFQTPFADALTGMGRQAVRTALQGAASVLALSAGLLLIPPDPAAGVIATATVVHGSLLIAYIAAYFRLRRSLANNSQEQL